MEVQSERINQFADYFVICGLDLKTGLEPDINPGDSQLHRTPLDRTYKCHVLTHYPETVPWNPFDEDAICLLSLPEGLHFRTQKHNLDPNLHSFIVTQKDGLRYYGFSLVFYEKAQKEICGAMQTLQAMHLAEMSEGQKKLEKPNYSTRSLPKHFKIMSQQFSLAKSYYDVSKDMLYVTKCIVLISQYPYLHANFLFLMNLFRNWKEGSQLSLESYIYYLLNEVKVPAPGCNLTFFINYELKVTIRSPDPKELPLCDFPIHEIFHLLDVDSLLYLFTSVMLEKQVLLCSSKYQNLMLVAETVNCLLFPFSWPHVYVPILPASLKHFLDAPVPFIMGVNCNSSPNFTAEASLCLIDLDSQTIQLPEDLLVFPNHREFASDIVELLDQYNIPTHNFFRLIKNSESRYKFRKNDLTMKMSLSSENLLNKSFHSDDDLINSFDNNQYMFQTMNLSTVNGVDNYMVDTIFNAAIRELFLHKFLHLFSSYEKYIISPDQDHEQWLNDKESLQNFDKVSFLREHSENYEFLSQFIETQMFTNFIDAKIQSYWCTKETNLRIFDIKIQLLQQSSAVNSSNCSCFDNCNIVSEYQSIIQNQYSKIDFELPPPEEVFSDRMKPSYSTENFPLLNLSVFKNSISKLCRKSHTDENSVHNMDIMTRSGSEAHPLTFGERLTIVKSNTGNNSSHISPAMIAQTNWNFVEKLLKDCKQRTKKMLVTKLGCEAEELGHHTQNVQMEENTLILGLCDLLERIWSHGLQNKQGKSALWYYITQFKEVEKLNEERKQTESILHAKNCAKINPILKSSSSFANTEDISVFVLEPLPVSLINDLKFVETLTDIKTPIGLAKAWVRLSLEKKLLSRHLKTILSNQVLLKSTYKRYAFLRCEDEKEQFLFHLLSLNAVDYYCFTNTYVNCYIPYRVFIYSSTKIASSMASNCWIILSGQNRETEKITIPKGRLEFVFHYKNLGVLTLLRIGQENKSFSLKWLVNWVIVRNEITGHVFSFPCGRWLGRGVDDDSSERLLIGKRISETDERGRGFTATRIRSPSVPPMKPYILDSEIQHNLSECVNDIIKFYYGQPKKNESIATLLCGEQGLVHHLEQMFFFGFKSSRFFGRNLYIWDFIEKVEEEMNIINDETNEGMVYFCKLVDQVRNASASLGREGRFQVFICVSIRDHTINTILKILSESKITIEMYEEHSFLRKKSLFYFLTHLLDSLYDLDIFLENNVTLGISIESP